MANKPETDELLAYLAQLIETTSTGSVNWAEANPTTYTWDSTVPGRGGKVAIQAISRRDQSGIPRRAYVFTVVDPRTNVQKLAIDGGTDVEVNQKLKDLFNAVQASITRKGLDFLKSILPHQ